MTELRLTFSRTGRAAVQTNRQHSTGESLWGREVFHAKDPDADLPTTYCGRDCSDWFDMGARSREETISDFHFCKRCAAALRRADND